MIPMGMSMSIMPNFCVCFYCNLSGISSPQTGRDVYRGRQLDELDINRVYCTLLHEKRKEIYHKDEKRVLYPPMET